MENETTGFSKLLEQGWPKYCSASRKWPTEGFPNVKGCGSRKRATGVFFQKLKGTRTKEPKNIFS